MAWNRTEKRNEAVQDSLSRLRRSFAAMAAMAVLICAGGVALWLWIERSSQKQVSNSDRVAQGLIPDASHSASNSAKDTVKSIDKEPEPKRKWPEKSPHPDGEWRHGEGPRSIAVTNGCLVTYPNYPGVQLVLPHPAFAAPFENISDNELARILTARPGDDFIDAPLPNDFDARFAESLLSPIRITDKDSPEKAEMKRLVIEARKTLSEAVKRGESPRQILDAEAKNLRRLMQIKDNYQRLVNEQIENCASEAEISELVDAANRVLEKEGVECRILPPGSMRLRAIRERLK